ncbi:hypothetical protein EUGRSUZ_C01539, partial [Eucalyptus grandis]
MDESNDVNQPNGRLALIYFRHNVDEDPLGALSSWNDSFHHCEWQGVICGGRHPERVLGSLSKLQALGLAINSLSGSIPHSIGNLSQLCKLSLRINGLQGEIPKTLSKLHGLSFVQLAYNQLTGEIPSAIFNLSSIFNFRVDNNQLRGSIPHYIGDTLHSLVFLDFHSNLFTGVIPPSLSNASGLQYIYYDINTLHNLHELYLSRNMLTGEIPSSIGNLTLLNRFYLSFNHFYGEIPQSLAPLPPCLVLGWLNLAFNSFHGEIPLALSTLRGLQELDVSHNNLSGEIPSFLTQLTDLKYLNLSSNKLEGEVPKQGVFLNASAVSIFENRNLCGDGFSEINVIGKGRYGTIYKATTQEGSLVAVKVLNLGHIGALKSFVSECRTLGAIRHRNLVKIVNVCSSVDYHGNDFKALLYEYMANGSVENWIHQGNEEDVEREHELGKPRHLGLMQRLDIAIDIASAIEYLHEVCCPKIVHGDLKPSNVLLDNEMMGRGGDFGLATISSPKKTDAMNIDDSSNSMSVRGSIGYVPPEYGMGDMVSTQGDMYSYGILLLEMLTGRRPTEETFKDHLNLHNFFKVALPDRVMEIVDLAIINGESENDIERMKGCVASVLRIGVACSMELPQDRMDVAKALKELHKIRA